MLKEVWCIHPRFTDYSISNAGRVKRVRGGVQGARIGRILKAAVHRTGYLHVKLDRRSQLVHVLVLEAFVGPRGNQQHARHLNGVRADNRLTNLAWGTAVENYADSVEHGTAARGERHGKAILSEQDVSAIRGRYALGGISQRALAAEYGLNHSTVQALIERRTWREVK